MWPQLNVWIMRPGSACRVDDSEDWTVYVADAHCDAFTWKGIAYTDGRKVGTPGHLACEIPPGTYVVWAERPEDGGTLSTERAIAVVGCEGAACVRLLTRVEKRQPPEPDPEPEPDCTIEIAGVRGRDVIRQRFPRTLAVSGTASGCSELVVTVRGADDKAEHCKATVGSGGEWECVVPNERLGARCGEDVLVDAVCASDRQCRAQAALVVECEPGEGGEPAGDQPAGRGDRPRRPGAG